jgi:hypothetical protein
VCKRCKKKTHSTVWHDKWLPRSLCRATRTDEHKHKLGLAHKGVKASKATRQKMTQSQKNRLANMAEGACAMCGSQDHTYRQHQKRLVKARKHSAKWLKSVQDALTRRFTAGEGRPIRWPTMYDGKHGTITMQSTWEVTFAKKMDRWRINWKYEPRSFYVGKGKWFGKYYLPDFYLPKFDLYVEIKGHLHKHSKRKLQAFRRRYPNIKWIMLQKDDLEMIGVFDKSQDSSLLFSRKVLV